MKISAMVATDNIDSDGERFSPEALEDMVQQLPGKPIKIEFKHQVGSIESAEMVGGNVKASGVIDVDLDGIANQDLYLVPAFMMEEEDSEVVGSVCTIRRFELMCLGLTNQPADNNLTPIRWLDED